MSWGAAGADIPPGAGRVVVRQGVGNRGRAARERERCVCQLRTGPLDPFLPLDAIPLPPYHVHKHPAKPTSRPTHMHIMHAARALSGGRVRLPPAPRRRQATRPGPTAPHARFTRVGFKIHLKASSCSRRGARLGLGFVAAGEASGGLPQHRGAHARGDPGQSTSGGVGAPRGLRDREAWPGKKTLPRSKHISKRFISSGRVFISSRSVETHFETGAGVRNGGTTAPPTLSTGWTSSRYLGRGRARVRVRGRG